MDFIILDLGDGFKGDSLVPGYEGKIDIMSYSHNVAMQVTNDASNAERTSGKPHVGEFTLTKFVDRCSADLNVYCCAGKPIASAIIMVGRSDDESIGPVQALITYTLADVIISNVSVSGGAGGKPVETLSLNFTKITWLLGGSGHGASSWDLAANRLV